MAGSASNRYGFLIDLDGVIYEAERIVSGALQTLEWMQRQQIPHLFVTNTTSRCRDSLLQKFDSLGFTAKRDEVMTPIVAAVEYLKQRNLRKVAAFVPEDAARDLREFEQVTDESETGVDAVIIGDLGDAWDYRRMNQAFRLLMREPMPSLIALGMTRYWRGADGLLLDVAPFVKALEHAADCEAIVVGKPAPAFFHAALRRLQCSAAQTFMIGDDIKADVGAAQECGIRGIQVCTGKYRAADLEGVIQPFAVLGSIAELPDWWAQATA